MIKNNSYIDKKKLLLYWWEKAEDTASRSRFLSSSDVEIYYYFHEWNSCAYFVNLNVAYTYIYYSPIKFYVELKLRYVQIT